ncbi:hypothetical protein ACLF3G_16510 [Falsiroseomonas sp. HC035]|uniref:hypothetical protein n=1 Tax=Falsiroseomonas sp. HC035 TaxID=3390999 RepID=UPI003D319737
MTLIMPSAAAAEVTDSIFTWTFTANSGDSWGGTLVEDTGRYVIGSTLATAQGRYTITGAVAQGIDLSEAGFAEGWISVGWYRDSTGAWMLTELGEAAAAGSAGLGSERDAAWTGTGWDSFGQGGADQADPGDLADSLFTWTFTATSGDVLYGTLLADTADWNIGDTLATAHGSYRITGESAYGRDLAEAGAEGTVHTTRYSDAQSRVDFPLESGGAGPTGYGGLGSELDRVWTGSALVPVGQGGALQADRLPDRIFNWTFQATNGDTYSGRLVGHSTAWAPGDTLATAHGTYTINTAAALGGQVIADGTVWTTTGYFDASANQVLPSYSATVLGGAPSGNAGLGSELDRAWDGDEWDDFGRGGQFLASIERITAFQWRFESNTGDRYLGWVIEDFDSLTVGSIQATATGRYVIEAAFGWTGSLRHGTVFTSAYYDASAETWMPTYTWSAAGGQPSGSGGLGSELDYAWDGDQWLDFGQGGANLASVDRNSVFGWQFTANNGDSYQGWLIAGVDGYDAGDVVATAHGRYTISEEQAWSGAQPAGTIWTTAYSDSAAGRTMPTYFWSAQVGAPSGTNGFGSEYDYAWNGTAWLDFGLGGSNLARAGAAGDLLG